NLWAVADGMGGQSRGDLAAETVIRALAELEGPCDGDRLLATVAAANRQIYRTWNGQSGTTLVLLRVAGSQAHVWWIGDSRAYLVRRERLTRLTRDHSLVQDLVDAGLLDEGQAARHPQANVITRAIGIVSDPELDARVLDLEPGDRILLCSDGLSRTLDERDFVADLPLAHQTERLLANALRRDGTDNTSFVLIAFGAVKGA
ncbi:MAG TPA: protein phosphatase 2C domain-containing protein, partial [Croceibacterium sp.]|nr:protein phosphatase 2C domain-containing protein [Croceibacterium sp.]